MFRCWDQVREGYVEISRMARYIVVYFEMGLPPRPDSYCDLRESCVAKV
jgi:hypothetical protein